MTVPPGFEVTLVASEPMISQPVAIEFDDRGRLWVIQYLQYPNPAGLNRVKWDRYSRTTYDRVPEPPPHGPKGADRITILEDTDGDGQADKAKDFVYGLNLISAMAFGHGGVFVVQDMSRDLDQHAEPAGERDVATLQVPIVFDGVCFRHGETDILRNVDVVLRPKETVGIVGESGAGKTTFFHLLTGLLEPCAQNPPARPTWVS